MRLLRLEDDGEFSLTKDLVGDDIIPPYAILSHTWGSDNEEVTFKDLTNGAGKDKPGYRKIRFCGKQAANDGLRFFWIDTCCINKSSSTELAEAINTMFRWYQEAARCYVYLSDVSVSGSVEEDEISRRWKPAFKKSRWFTRGWTLQELIAPPSVEFFSKEEQRLGDKQSLEQTLHEITGIAVQALQGSGLSHFSVNERMSWAEKRQTKREEDAAYSLLGIFDIQMPLIYGEGRKWALARLHKEIKESLKDELPPLGEEKKRILLDSLRFAQIDARQTAVGNAHAKTCEWLLKNPQYLDWLDTTKQGEHHGFLWIKGKPGTGKSTLMKFALTNARNMMKDKIVISFFFNARGGSLEKSTIGTYQSLLLQLLERLPVLQDVFDSIDLSSSEISIYHEWSVESLKTLLEQAIQRLEQSSVLCFIDALDECEERQIRDMISFFEHVGVLAVSAGIKFRVCFSGRHYPYIEIQRGLSLFLEEQEGHIQDITNYLDSELKIGHGEVAEQIRRDLQEKASGIFIWLVLVVRILNKGYDHGHIHGLRQRLWEVPADLHSLFRDILTRDSHNRDELVLCVQWLLFSKQPLSPEQFFLAILSGIEPESLSKWDPAEITIDVIRRFILGSSKGLAKITTSGTPRVEFIHESVRDFLLKENELSNIYPDLGSNFQGQSHERLKHCCLNYLSINVFTQLEIHRSLPHALSQKAADFHQSPTSAYPFLEYAVHNVLYHADFAAGCGIAQENLIRSFPLGWWIKLDNMLAKEFDRHTENVSLLYVLAEGNMSNLIRVHPSILSYLEAENERYGTPLFAALARKSQQAVRTFLEAHAANQCPGSLLHKRCSRYCQQNHGQGGFDRTFEYSTRRTILSYLAELGDEVIFNLVLETGRFMPDSKDEDGRTPLSLAAGNGHEAVLKLLLNTSKVDVDSKDQDGQTPLLWAARNGHETVIKLLLDTGNVDVYLKDQYGQTPLLWAARNGHETVVKLLLATGKVHVDSKDAEYGRTALPYAAGNQHDAMVNLLIAKNGVDGVEIDSQDNDGRTPLLWAAHQGHYGVVKLLLECKADVNVEDRYGWTGLLRAVDGGHETIVRLLLEQNVDVNAKGDQFFPLSLAAINRNKTVMEVLLAAGASIQAALDTLGSLDAQAFLKQTALCYAAAVGKETMVQELIAIGVDVNDSSKPDLKTPLHFASEYGHISVLTALLEANADPTKEDQLSRTPLHYAGKSGSQLVVQRLRRAIYLHDRVFELGICYRIHSGGNAVHLIHVTRKMKDYSLLSDILHAYELKRCRGWRKYSLKGLRRVDSVEYKRISLHPHHQSVMTKIFVPQSELLRDGLRELCLGIRNPPEQSSNESVWVEAFLRELSSRSHSHGTGFGLRCIEGWVLRRIIICAAACLVCASLIGILWATLLGKTEAGFAITACLIAAEGLAISLFMLEAQIRPDEY
ncbi:MAG: hypothetical protein M1813_004832 [Trichoglossum hirsutum]|nr:MAG: hypothetical protein M1813_004832 [Trichoglossum hirsutum]